jgi:hypothetical protein
MVEYRCSAPMVELADTGDSKSPALTGMGVRLPLGAPKIPRSVKSKKSHKTLTGVDFR